MNTQIDTHIGAHAEDVEPGICTSHVLDNALHALLEIKSSRACEWCPQTSDSYLLEDVSEAVTEAFKHRFQSPAAAGLRHDQETDTYQPEGITRETNDALDEILEDAFDDLAWQGKNFFSRNFDNPDWAPSNCGNGIMDMEWGWQQFEEEVKTKNRYLFFEDSSSGRFLKVLSKYLEPEHGLLTGIPANTPFYRGRPATTPEETWSKAKELGPAPAGEAAANRMSPEGVPMFYASAAPETAIAEIVSHNNCKYTRIGTFQNTRTLTVFDLTKIPSHPSPFDKVARVNAGLLQFFRDFRRIVSQPLTHDMNERIEYLPTQILTAFFQWASEEKLDGIKLKSAQTGHDTYALFFTADDFEDQAEAASHSQKLTFTIDPAASQTYEIKRSISVAKWSKNGEADFKAVT